MVIFNLRKKHVIFTCEDIMFMLETSPAISLAPVVQMLDNAIHRINHYPVNRTNHAIHWIVIYLVDRVIQPLNNRGLVFT